MEPVTLLHFTPLCTDGYGPQGYGNYTSAAGCNMAQELPVSIGELSMDTASTAMRQPPYSYVGSTSCEAYGSLAMEQTGYCTQQEQMQSSRAVPPIANRPVMVQEYDQEFNVLMSNANDPGISDISVGPPPIRLPRLDAPMTIDTASTVESGYQSPAGSRAGSLYSGSPHSPISMTGDSSHHRNKSYSLNKTYPKNRPKSSRVNKLMRATSPMFPDQSTPLSNFKRQPSTSSITSLDTFSISVKSDPGNYNPHTSESTVNSPSTNSPGGFELSSATSVSSLSATSTKTLESSSRSCLELEIPAKYARRISELDKKIIKLQVERSKVLEKAQQTKSAPIGATVNPWCVDMDSWLITEKLPEVGKAHLYIFPLGIHELDEPLYDDANRLLRQVGGLYLDLQTSISILRSICCKGMFIPAEISTCFAYIKSLLHEYQKLKLSNLQGVYSIQLDAEEGIVDGVLPMEFSEALSAANNVLKCAQHITQSYHDLQMQLLKMRQVAAGQADSCSAICQKLDVMDRERRGQIRALLEGNCITMASAERVWPQYYQVATQTIKIITECIHPSSSNCQ